ncbi:MAG: 30S ribosomal protein S7 [Candidatus Marinimicrobia bacterium]|jgi:small subunit ribosomal protein S7|nr:30S ribosomal protein S7 [Candidatus Neomarinimicrobiota bacterium]MCK9482923.1 30S ribosomal protein S7 [Candidatus Neomarinimicrobiota bacterium]MCK9560295.1 30S ribosomal protein S7 [Candidatus Neomarinimicrobiota bacterium]MDD5060724.1 30S ribosomal protein S7 [Candidatus Neomarinimicrobiota bacterium]MDD5230814.1 30S ribosomal protein S7 [Candidatus Neomarinimicrobiota bacterium]
MSRRKKIISREILPDPKYGDIMVARFINYLLRKGKKSVAEASFYDAITQIEGKRKGNGLEVFRKAINNVSPIMEVKSRRIGGATYQVPIEVKTERRFALASRWLINYAKSRPGKSMAEKLAAELMAAADGEGGAIKKREDTHKMAEANKAFAHFR